MCGVVGKRWPFAVTAAAARVMVYATVCIGWLLLSGVLVWAWLAAEPGTPCVSVVVGRSAAFVLYQPGWVQLNVRCDRVLDARERRLPLLRVRANTWSGPSLVESFLFYPKLYHGGQLGPIRYGRWNPLEREFQLYSLLVPAWMVWAVHFGVGVTVIGLPMMRQMRRRRDALKGRCANCGYDLRATPERCPECGAVPKVA
jgi:hypothetical protein